MTTTTAFPTRSGFGGGRLACAVLIVVCLSSGPFVALSRWAADVPLALETWPYTYTYWAAAALGLALFAADVMVPISSESLRRSEALLVQMSAPVVLAVWAMGSAFWTDSPARTPQQASLMALVVATAIWFGYALTFRQHVVSLFVGLHAMTLVSLAVSVSLRSARFPNDGSWIGVFNNPNTLNPIAGLGVVAAAGVVILSDRFLVRVTVGVCVVADIVVMWNASSATGLLALGGAVVAGGLVALSRGLHARGVPLATIRRVGAAVVVVAVLSIPWSLRLVPGLVGKDATLTGRTDIWDYVVDVVGDRPLVGFGFASFWDTEANRVALGERREFSTVPDAAHSSFMETLLFLGGIGLVLLLVVVAMSLGRTWLAALGGRSWPMAWWAAVSTFALVENVTESMIAYHSIFWVLLVAAGFAAIRASTDGEDARADLTPPTGIGRPVLLADR